MKVVKKVKSKIESHRYGKLFLEEYDFKTIVLSLLSLCVNVGFAVMNGVSAFIYRSIWYMAIAIYYVMLILFRAGVIIADKKCKKAFTDEREYSIAQKKIHLSSGCFLVIMQMAMCVAVTQMIMFDRPVKSGNIMAIATALYSFVKISLAIYNLNRAKSKGNPVTRSLRYLNFADACMSMASLTVLMLSTFSDGSEIGTLYLKSSVGFAVCAIVLAVATKMIIWSVKAINEEKRGASLLDEREAETTIE